MQTPVPPLRHRLLLDLFLNLSSLLQIAWVQQRLKENKIKNMYHRHDRQCLRTSFDGFLSSFDAFFVFFFLFLRSSSLSLSLSLDDEEELEELELELESPPLIWKIKTWQTIDLWSQSHHRSYHCCRFGSRLQMRPEGWEVFTSSFYWRFVYFTNTWGLLWFLQDQYWWRSWWQTFTSYNWGQVRGYANC